jgi:WD40 repeat protein
MTVFSPDGRHVLVGTTTGRLHVLGTRTLEPIRDPIQIGPSTGSSRREGLVAIENLVASPDGRTVLAIPLQGRPQFVDYQTGIQRALDVDAFGAAFSPDATRLFVTTRTGRAGLLQVATGAWISPPDDAFGFGGWSVVFSPNGSEAATTAGGRVGRWDGRTGAFLGFATFVDPGVLAYNADGSAIVVTGAKGRVNTWDLNPASWVEAACRLAGRPLTEREWSTHLPDRAPHPVCAG